MTLFMSATQSDLNTYLRLSGTPDHLRHLMIEIATASKYIHHSIKTGELGLAGTSNLYGEMQLELDVLSDKILTDTLLESGLVSCLASEEKGEMIECSINKNNDSEYVVTFDPLDGSSLVDTNNSVGSILGIFKKGDLAGKKGSDMVAAIYVVYGPRTTFVYTIGNGTHEFTLNDVGEYMLSRENLKVKEVAKRFAPGNLRACAESKDYLKLLQHWVQEGYTLRYSGGMVPDINTILMKGDGVFVYPSWSKQPRGKLRYCFECAPMAFIMEQAGGAASDGDGRLLDQVIKSVDQQTPIIIGSKKEVEKAVEYLNG